MGKIIVIAAVVLLVIVIIVPLGVYYGSDTRDRKIVTAFPDAQTPVKTTVSLPLIQVRARLIKKWGVEFSGPNSYAELSHPEYGPQFNKFTVLPNVDGNIDSQFRATDTGFSSDAPISTKGIDLQAEDPGLPAYLQLPIHERKHDLQVESHSRWMTNDIQKDGRPLPYKATIWFICKLKSNETEILILGLHATVVDGQRWSVVGDMFVTPPRRVDNVRNTPPSPADKRAMLENVLKTLKT